MPIDPQIFFIVLGVILVSLGLHEYAHAKVADAAGDPTPGYYGRVTLNLFKHLDPLGTIMIIFTALVGFGIGWGKPVPMDPRKMRNPRWDHFAAVAAGPITNLLIAAICAVMIRAGFYQGVFGAVLLFGIIINLSLFLFNLLPIGPLDGMWILSTFLPERSRMNWIRWNMTFGQFLFLGILILGWISPELSVIRIILLPLMGNLFRLLTGAEFPM